MRTRRLSPVVVGALLMLLLVAVSCGGSIRDSIGDGTLTARVMTALVNDPEVGRYRFEVETYRGVVMISGEVSTADAAPRAVAVVRNVEEVRDVRSTIRVTPQ